MSYKDKLKPEIEIRLRLWDRGVDLRQPTIKDVATAVSQLKRDMAGAIAEVIGTEFDKIDDRLRKIEDSLRRAG